MLHFTMLALAMVSAEAFTSPLMSTRLPLSSFSASTSSAQMAVSRGGKPDTSFCYGLPGSLQPAPKFDPLDFLKNQPKETVRKWREAELTHGRVAMLASLGFLVQEYYHPLFSGIGGPAVDQIPQLPVPLWFLMTLGIGVTEGYRISVGFSSPNEPNHSFQKLKPEYINGDLGFDPLGLMPDDPEEFLRMQNRELNHGRLAMIGAAGFLAQEATTHTTWGSYWGVTV